MLSLSNIISRRDINFSCYADDAQLYLSFRTNANRLANFQAALKVIKMWMTCKFLLLKSDRSEIMIISPTHLRDEILNGI